MRIFLILVIVTGVFAALWFGGREARFYFGPSERLLSKTGYNLSNLGANQSISQYRFAPMYPFWSDGAEKSRSIYIPPSAKIDTSNQDRWNFPIGTRIWKNFERDNVLVETRMLYKYGTRPWDWDMAVYLWRDDFTDADKLATGKADAHGTEHDIPSPSLCITCHGSGEQRRPLGITAIQLPYEHGSLLSLTQLENEERLTKPLASAPQIPGDDVTQKALGYLDTNCGSCHSDGSTFVSKDIPLRLNLTIESLGSIEETNAYKTTINKVPNFKGLDTDVYISPGSPEKSFLYKRLTTRGDIWQMPPLSTETVDDEGAQVIREWIESMLAN